MKQRLGAAWEKVAGFPGAVSAWLRASIRDVFLFGGLGLLGVGLYGYDWRVACGVVGALMVVLWALPMMGGRVGDYGDQ